MNNSQPTPQRPPSLSSASAAAPVLVRTVLGALFTLLVIAPGCKRGEPKPSAEAAESQPVASPNQAEAAPEVQPPGNPNPVGPLFEIIAGKGIGPIRFGATFETLERHMTRPCDVRTTTKCIYVNQAVEFTMKDGVVSHIQIHRRDRPAPKTETGALRSYGTFYGGMWPDIQLGLHRHVAMEEMRPADRVEPLPKPDANGTIERQHYPGLIVEYDKVSNGNTVLGGFQILPHPDAKSPALSEKKPHPAEKLSEKDAGSAAEKTAKP